VNDLTDSRGVACCFDAVGGGTAADAYGCLAVKGKMLVYGRMSPDDFLLNNATLIYRNLSIKGFGIDEWLGRAPQATRSRMMRDVIEAVSAGRLRLPVAASYPLEKALGAIRHSRAPAKVGKVLLTI
jgi:NADPH:quinone reductase-like Zn-dependent oxidoreductase